MSRKRDLASEIVEFFQTAPPDTAATVFGIVRGIVDRRNLLKAKQKATRPRVVPAPEAATK